MQDLDYRQGEELSWCSSWSNSLWQGWGCGLVHCPCWKCHWPDLKSAGLFPRNLFLNSPKNFNIVTLTLWPINSALLTSLLLPNLSSSHTNSLPSFNLLCYSKTDSPFIQDAPKAVWSIPYFFCGIIFSKFKQNFIAYRSSKVSSRPDCICEIHQLWTIRL